MKTYTKLLSLVIFLISCQTMDITEVSYQCDEMDWFEIGRADAAQGQKNDYYQSKSEQCSDFKTAHRAQYLNGWNTGLDSFCTSQQGFVFGRQGRGYNEICPSNSESLFLNGYDKGLQVFNYEKNNKKITNEIQETSKLVDEVPPRSQPELLKKINQLETQLELNRALIAEIQSEVAPEALKNETSRQ